MPPEAYRCLSGAVRSTVRPEYRQLPQDRNQSGLQDGYAVPHHRTVFLSLSTMTDNPVQPHLKIPLLHGFLLKSGRRSDAAVL